MTASLLMSTLELEISCSYQQGQKGLQEIPYMEPRVFLLYVIFFS